MAPRLEKHETGLTMGHLPTDTVTFLFTDIEGSTQLWERQPELMSGALSRHNLILDTAIRSHGGVIFKTVGDAFCAAFPTAPAALAAAVTAQQALMQEPWPQACTIRVRMALHTGAVEEQEGDYLGPPVNRVARLLSAGHGGQTLLSLATQEIVRDTLPPQITLLDLGEHRLKDLIRPEHIYGLVHPDLPAEFPPLKTLDYRPTNLPVQPTPFIGREEEVRAVAELLQRPEVRLVTLTGPGGTGKTRLALQVGAELIDSYSDGVWVVFLASLSDPQLVLSTIAAALGVRETGGQSLQEAVTDYLRDRELLLILDNLEHLLPAAFLISDVLAAAPRLTVVATSRALVRLSGEHEYTVPPLSVPDPHRLPPLEMLCQYDAVALFIQRAVAAKREFAVTNENARAVAEICHRLDGLPLALELAAARIRMFPPQALLSRLDNRLKLLTGGARELPARQQTLRGAIDWSYSLLDDGEQTLFARLSVFVGGCTIEAAEAVCDAEGDLPRDVLDGITSLLEKSLLRQDETEGGEPRVSMLETIREYAAERLEHSGTTWTVQERHAHYYRDVVQALDQAGAEALLARFDDEHDNLRSALRWAIGRGKGDLALELAASLAWFWAMRGYMREGRDWLNQALTIETAPTKTRALALVWSGQFAVFLGDVEAGITLVEQALALFRALDEVGDVAQSLKDLGTLLALYQCEYERAIPLLEESVAMARRIGWGVASCLENYGLVLECAGHYERATGLLEEAVVLYRRQENAEGLIGALAILGRCFLERNDLSEAEALLRESLARSKEMEMRWNSPEYLEAFAALAVKGSLSRRSARLFGAAATLRASMGTPLPPAVRPAYDRYLTGGRNQVDGKVWEAAWAEGVAMSLEEAIAYALGDDTGK